MTTAAIIAGWVLVGYLAGSIPFGWLIGKMRGVDIREHGSKNIGATNCGRVCGWPWGVLAFTLDVVKGFAPVYVAALLMPGFMRDADSRGLWLALVGIAFSPILGHLFPVWLGFKGGKAVATSLGVLLGLPILWWAGLAALGVWIVVTGLTRYVSVGSTAAALALLGIYLCVERAKAWDAYLPITVFVFLVVVLVIVRHRSNYARLVKGTENPLWGGKKTAAGEEKPAT